LGKRFASGATIRQLAPAPLRADAVRVGVGHGQSTDQYGVSLQFDRAAPVHESARSRATAHAELGAGEFQRHRGSIHHNTVRALAAVALRWQRPTSRPVEPFIDAGLGLSGLSEATLNGDRHFSASCRFTELLRFGLRFGSRQQFELAVGTQHFSNAGLRRPNDSITYAGVSAAWHWR
jgi:hypothetical protein